jgi:hypothetical protein
MEGRLSLFKFIELAVTLDNFYKKIQNVPFNNNQSNELPTKDII